MKIDPNKYKPMTGRDTTEWQEVSREMTEYYKKNCYWIPWRYPMHLIKEKFKIAQQENRPFNYFLGMLRK